MHVPGGYAPQLNSLLDGKDQWTSIKLGLPSVRNETLLNINERERNAALTAVYQTSSYYRETWKIVYGTAAYRVYYPCCVSVYPYVCPLLKHAKSTEPIELTFGLQVI